MHNTTHRRRIILTLAICLVLLGIAAFFLLKTLPAKKEILPEPAAVQQTAAAVPEREQAYEGDIPEAVQQAQQQQALYAQESAEMQTARAYLAQMTPDEEIYQLFFVTPEQLTGEEITTAYSAKEKNALETAPVGGILFFKQNLQDAGQTKTMIAALQDAARTPLFIGVDEEGGSISRLGGNADFGVPKLSPMASYGKSGDTGALKADMADLASTLSYLGFNTNFAPVSDVAATEDSLIGSRSFGSEAAVCSTMVACAVEAMQSCKVAACLKHFPGYGSVKSGDSGITTTLSELKASDFLPFAAGIEADSAFVMVSHLPCKAVTGTDCPANHSYQIVTDLLRTELGFSHIIITDAQNTASVTASYTTTQTVLAALEAGCDMILMPENLQEAHDAVLNALQTGTLSKERLDESVLRILAVKAKLGLITT